MITERDLVRLPYTADLTEAGLVYARRVLLNRHGAAAFNRYDTVRRTAASAALNLALRRYLGANGVLFGVQDPTPFSDPDRYDLLLGGRMCELKTYLISRASQWRALSDDPRLALGAPALVPLDRHTTDTVRARDIYVFAFVGARVASQGSGASGQAPPQGEYWMHVLPTAWQGGQRSAPLGPVVLKAEATADMSISVEGRDQSGSPVGLSVMLGGGRRVDLPESLLTLSHICTLSRPSGRLGIHARARRLTHVIEPGDWHNVWLEGWGMMLLGWMTRQEFRTRSKLMAQGRRVFQFDRTKTRNLAVPVSDLKPIAELPGQPGT